MTRLGMPCGTGAARARALRTKLLLSCAAAAMIGASLPSRAAAQGFAGSPSFDQAKVAIDRSQAGRDTITLKAPSAVIDWTPADNQGTGAIDFLPRGNSALFQNDPQITNFAVLNRILPPTRRAPSRSTGP